MKKKLIFTVLLAAAGLSAFSADFTLPAANVMTDLGTMQNTDAQLRLLEQQQFRKKEFNEFKDMKEFKAQQNKELEDEQRLQTEEGKILPPENEDVDFIRENGQIKIKRTD